MLKFSFCRVKSLNHYSVLQSSGSFAEHECRIVKFLNIFVCMLHYSCRLTTPYSCLQVRLEKSQFW